MLYHNGQAPGVLSSQVYSAVEALMLGERPQFSFAEQMERAVATEPTAFLVTAKSAVPVADSIRGFYEEIGEEIPRIDYIDVPRHTFFRNIHNYIERKRLQRSLEGFTENVFVVDEFVFSGDTLKRAKTLLQEIGCERNGMIRGRWYSQAARSEIDLDNVTSVHAPRMHAIGRLAAQSI